MLYRHLFDKIFTKFRGILRVFVNFAAPRPHKIPEALIITLDFLRQALSPYKIREHSRGLSRSHALVLKAWN